MGAKISAALTELSPSELRKLKSECEGLLNAQGVEAQGADLTDAQHIHWLFTDKLKAEGKPCLPFFALTKAAHYSTFIDGVKMFYNFVDHFLKPANKTEREKAVQVLPRMLARRLERDGVPVSHSSLSSALQRVSSIVDDQFPGYRESGLLPMLISSHQR